MTEMVVSDRDDDVVLISIDNPPVNALSPGIPEKIGAEIQLAESLEGVDAVVLIGSGPTFIAGADIRQLQKYAHDEESRDTALLDTLALMDQTGVLLVCAIHGTALGGGLELAQACHYRIAAGDARMGQPEVKLGIIPGAGGTQRLPRLVGTLLAAELCSTGRLVDAHEALETGLVDRISFDDVRTDAVAYARELLRDGAPHRKTSMLAPTPGSDAEEEERLDRLRESIRRRSRGAVAGLRAIEAVEGSRELSFADGCKREAKIFEDCLRSDQCRASIHAFFAEREVRKIPDLPKDAECLPVHNVAIVGGGTMGRGIAMAYLDAGYPVILKELDSAAADAAKDAIAASYQRSSAKGRLDLSAAKERLSRLSTTDQYAGFEDAELVVEAVFEGMDLKKEVFSELSAVVSPTAILASNTSTLDIDAIASVVTNPRRVVGHHFFSPANIMRLLEIVRGSETSSSVIATSMNLARKLRKVGVVVGNCRGFVGNRMFGPYMREAQLLLEEGATVTQVDEVLVEFGMAMGPLAVGDLAGLDVGWRIRKEYSDLEEPGARQQTVADRLCESGHYGLKTGRGWYRYADGNRTPLPESDTQHLIETCAGEAGIVRREIDASEIRERTLFALVNEGARILADGMAMRSSDIDVIYLNGYGFPAHRGGPMWYADSLGLDYVLKRIRHFQSEHGANWEPAPLLIELADRGGTFSATHP